MQQHDRPSALRAGTSQGQIVTAPGLGMRGGQTQDGIIFGKGIAKPFHLVESVAQQQVGSDRIPLGPRGEDGPSQTDGLGKIPLGKRHPTPGQTIGRGHSGNG